MFAVYEEYYHKDDNVGDSLIELCRVAGKILTVLYENETPVSSGGLTYNLRVHEVAQTYAGCGERSGNAYHVNALQDLDLILTAVQDHSDNDTYRSAVAGQTAVTYQLPASLGHGWEAASQ